MKKNIIYKIPKSNKRLLREFNPIDNNSDLFNEFIKLPANIQPSVLIGDVLEMLKKIPSESISCIVTSPPYWNLKDYYDSKQIGREKNAEEYINKILDISKELLRVLKKDGAYFLNIGDTYVDKGLQMIPQRIAAKMIEEIKIIGKNKKKIGWLLRNQIIWYKPNHMPSPVKSRFSNTYEPIFFFTRDDWEKDVYFDIDAIRVPYKSIEKECSNGFSEFLSEEDYKKIIPEIEAINKGLKYNGKFKGNEVNIGSSPGGRSSVTGINYVLKRKNEPSQDIICDYLRDVRNRKGISAQDIDKILGYRHTAGHWFRKDAGGSLPTSADWIKLKNILNFNDKYDRMMTEMHYVLQIIRKHPKGKNPGDLWMINTAKLPDKHFAVFPEEIPKKAILSCCPLNGIVLDPFAGSGTTGKVAKELGRKSILIELQPKFIEIIKKRCGEIQIVQGEKAYGFKSDRTVGIQLPV